MKNCFADAQRNEECGLLFLVKEKVIRILHFHSPPYENPTFRTLFSNPVILSAFQPSIAFRGAKHCFSPEKALLFSKRSVAQLSMLLFSLQNQVKKCSKVLIPL